MPYVALINGHKPSRFRDTKTEVIIMDERWRLFKETGLVQAYLLYKAADRKEKSGE